MPSPSRLNACSHSARRLYAWGLCASAIAALYQLTRADVRQILHGPPSRPPVPRREPKPRPARRPTWTERVHGLAAGSGKPAICAAPVEPEALKAILPLVAPAPGQDRTVPTPRGGLASVGRGHRQGPHATGRGLLAGRTGRGVQGEPGLHWPSRGGSILPPYDENPPHGIPVLPRDSLLIQAVRVRAPGPQAGCRRRGTALGPGGGRLRRQRQPLQVQTRGFKQLFVLDVSHLLTGPACDICHELAHASVGVSLAQLRNRCQ
jgi:hypothetical protein